MSHPIHTLELALHFVDPFESLDMCPISDDLLPLDEVFLESLILSDLLLDVGSVVTKSNPHFLSKLDIPIDRSSYVGLVESSNSPFEKQVTDHDEFDCFSSFLNPRDTEFVPADSISLVDFCSPFEVDIIDYKPLSLFSI